MFNIRKRSTGEIVCRMDNEPTRNTKEELKGLRNTLLEQYYSKSGIPEDTNNWEYYIVRSENHRKGVSR